MSKTFHVDCPAGVYTALSSGQANVSFTPATRWGGKMAIEASQPDPTYASPKTVQGGKEVNLGSLGTDNVYYMPGKDAETVEVIRG